MKIFVTSKFITNVSLLTSNGPYGYNVMAAEWTYRISYNPCLITVVVGIQKATYENIKNTKVFGVNLASVDQNIITSVAGNSTLRKVDKIELLKEFGCQFYKANTIDVLMVKGSAMNAECKVINETIVGDHCMFTGEVLSMEDSDKEPLIYHKGKFWGLGQNIIKPDKEILDKINLLKEKHKKI